MGVDLVEVDRVRRLLDRHPRAEVKLFTERERHLFVGSRRIQRMAGTFAAKEAVWKCLGRGFRGMSLHDVEILRDGAGKPEVLLSGGAAQRAFELGIQGIEVSISHEASLAVAQAIAWGGFSR
ncbi:MAG: holo-ACP synthase [Bacillota bacterium]|nr:holo-ACP synthase [Bacillota bacterium]